jgi:hypothetical protein
VKEYLLKKTRRILTILVLAAALPLASATVAWAGSPHFVDDQLTATRSGDTLTVSGKEAGLGDEAQVHVVLTADVQCVNPGGNEPKAENKGDVIASADVPVQNGKAEFTLSGVGVTDPDCSPPMTLVYRNVTVTDETNGITVSLAGVF